MEMNDKNQADLCIAAYNQVQNFYRLNNENYFKRTQVLMVLIESALFLSLARLWADVMKNECIGTVATARWVLSGVICILGILASYAWMEMIKRQRQRLEFCRYYMRYIERELRDLKVSVPLEFCTYEKDIIGNKRKA